MYSFFLLNNFKLFLGFLVFLQHIFFLRSKIASAGLARRLQTLGKKSLGVCGHCQFNKQLKSTHKVTTYVATSKAFELTHIDLMGPSPTTVSSAGSKNYIFVCINYFSRYTWLDLLKEKSDTFDAFKKLCLKLKKEKDCMIGKIMRIRSDHGREFENTIYPEFRDNYGISHEFSTPNTPKQNGVVKKKNRTLQEMARVMLNIKKSLTKL